MRMIACAQVLAATMISAALIIVSVNVSAPVVGPRSGPYEIN